MDESLVPNVAVVTNSAGNIGLLPLYEEGELQRRLNILREMIAQPDTPPHLADAAREVLDYHRHREEELSRVAGQIKILAILPARNIMAGLIAWLARSVKETLGR